MPVSLPDFIARWQASTLSERSASQSHFNDLCDLLGQPKPAEADQAGTWYTFEKGVSKTSGGSGFADVWMRDRFAWEYKGKHKSLHAAYQQLLQYREDLENPPLLVVCDLDRFEVHTNFTGTVKRVYRFNLADLASTDPTPGSPLPPLEVLRALFTDPDRLRPDSTAAQVTKDGVTEQYSYDADGERVKRTSGGVTTFYVGGVYEEDSNGTVRYLDTLTGQVVAEREIAPGDSSRSRHWLPHVRVV
jgi:hypothetical protein